MCVYWLDGQLAVQNRESVRTRRATIPVRTKPYDLLVNTIIQQFMYEPDNPIEIGEITEKAKQLSLQFPTHES